jgi:hypothetical protein
MTDKLTPLHYELLLELIRAAAFDGINLVDPVTYDLIGWRGLDWIEGQGHKRETLHLLDVGQFVKFRTFGKVEPFAMWRITMRGINEARTLTVKKDADDD